MSHDDPEDERLVNFMDEIGDQLVELHEDDPSRWTSEDLERMLSEDWTQYGGGRAFEFDLTPT